MQPKSFSRDESFTSIASLGKIVSLPGRSREVRCTENLDGQATFRLLDHTAPVCRSCSHVSLSANSVHTCTCPVGSSLTANPNASVPSSISSIEKIRPECRNAQREKKDKCLKLGCLNINSIGSSYSSVNGSMTTKKIDFIRNYLTMSAISILALTEYINSEESCLDAFFENQGDFRILSSPECKRVGLAFPSFLLNDISIIDVWSLSSERDKMKKGKSVTLFDKVCHMITYQIKISVTNFLMITVLYIVPDISQRKLNDVFEKINSYVDKYRNYIVVGDFNIDQKVTAKKAMTFDLIHRDLTQLVKKPTRVATRTRTVNKRKIQTSSSTIIDLAFVSDKILPITKCSVLKNTPSDHYLVELNIEYSLPSKFKVEKYYLDPTRRPALSQKTLPYACSKLERILSKEDSVIYTSCQSKGMQIIEKAIKTVLDKFCPLNSRDQKSKKVFRIFNSQKTKCYRNKVHRLLKQKRRLERQIGQVSPDDDILINYHSVITELSKANKALKKSVKHDKMSQFEDKCNDYINDPHKIWEFSKACDKQTKASNEPLKLKGKEGTDLANHMKDYMHKRAHLVDEHTIAQHAQYIPYPSKQISLDDIPRKEYDPYKLYFPPGKKPSLACGPDTISHRHIFDLFSVLKPRLKIILNKPIDKFYNIEKNYTRLIPKPGKPQVGKEEKLFRPIVEANILSKRGPLNIFGGELKTTLIPAINNNQFSFPKMGATMAVAELFDRLNLLASQKKPMIYAQFDASNAFCTYNHDVLMKIFASYGLPQNMLDLCKSFMNQSTTIFKISDINGYYLSDQDTTNCGGPQGQIGTDLFFNVSNDGMNPVKLCDDDDVDRKKYVDDFGDSYTSTTTRKVFDLLYHNLTLMKCQSNSIALSLNDGKTRVIPYNCDQEIIDHEKSQKRVTIHDDATILGYDFEFNSKPRKGMSYINTDTTAKDTIARLNKSCRKVITSRKVIPSLTRRINLAAGLVRASCYNLAIISIFSSKPMLDKIQATIRKTIKCAGLQYTTHNEDVYKISLGMSPQMMVDKQIIQLGLKLFDMNAVKEHRYLAKKPPDCANRPFQQKFVETFNNLNLDMRKTITNDYLSEDTYHKKMDRIKARLRDHFTRLYWGKNPSKKDITRLMNKNAYSLKKIKEQRAKTRKKKLDQFLQSEKPVLGKRKLINTNEIIEQRLKPKVSKVIESAST